MTNTANRGRASSFFDARIHAAWGLLTVVVALLTTGCHAEDALPFYSSGLYAATLDASVIDASADSVTCVGEACADAGDTCPDCPVCEADDAGVAEYVSYEKSGAADMFKGSACYAKLGASDQILYAFCRTMVDVALAPIDKITKPCDICNKLPEALGEICKTACKKIKDCTIGKIGDAVCCDQIQSTEIPLLFCRDRLNADPKWGRANCMDCCEKMKDSGKLSDDNRIRCRGQCDKAADALNIP